MTSPAEVAVLVADLHLACGPGDPFTADEEFARTVGDLLAEAGGRRFRLVLLGDSVDFPAVPLPGRPVTPATGPADAVAKLDRVLAAHPLVVGVLRQVVAAGQRIDVVAGNHDMELLLPAVQDRLRAAVGGGPDTVTVHPWFLHVPGVLHAEHGQQHHDVNRFPELGCPDGPGGPLVVPAGSYLDALVHLRARSPQASPPALAAQGARMAAGLVGGLVRLSRAERRRRSRERALAAGDAGLPPAVVVDLDRAGAATPVTILRRAGAMAARRLPVARPGPATPYMHGAAAAVDRVLAAHGWAVPFLVFGHTHVADDVPVPGGAPARYLNPGTWSTMLRRVPGGDRRCGVVVIEWAPEAPPRARLQLPA